MALITLWIWRTMMLSTVPFIEDIISEKVCLQVNSSDSFGLLLTSRKIPKLSQYLTVVAVPFILLFSSRN
jgi:hypothetical protein